MVSRSVIIKMYALLLLGAMLLCRAGMAFPGEVLDDSFSPRKQYEVQFEWAREGDFGNVDEDAYYLLRGSIENVEIRLNTEAYVGRMGRIYLTLPSHIDGYERTEGFRLSWKANRIFLSGEAIPGTRGLLFDGKIENSLMVELFSFFIEVDARYMTGKIRYAPIYEIEIY